MGFLRSHSENGDSKTGRIGAAVRLALRLLQFIFGLAVVGLYGKYVDRARRQHKYADGKWVFATVLGAMSSVMALVHFIPRVRWHTMWLGDAVLFIDWVVLFGIFGGMYINEDSENTGHGSGPEIDEMKRAVWIDLTNMFLWFITGLWAVLVTFWNRKKKADAAAADA